MSVKVVYPVWVTELPYICDSNIMHFCDFIQGENCMSFRLHNSEWLDGKHGHSPTYVNAALRKFLPVGANLKIIV